ncbi:MAG TPA: hypothetical protein VMS08_04535, partial [Candidatus Saccharimonadia bacterium]|nr:hypothetical protein [Candidatus Saccharimonadia bacterium]
MVILFLGTDDCFSTTLAEGYATSLGIPGISARAAVLRDETGEFGYRYALEVMTHFGLERTGKHPKTVPRALTLADGDIVICLNRTVYEAAKEDGVSLPLRTFVWAIPSVAGRLGDRAIEDGATVPHVALQTFVAIK